MKPAYIIAFFVIAVCMGVTLFTLSGSMAQHVTIKQAVERPGDRVQVPGDIIKESITYDARQGHLRFDICDRADRSQRLTVVYPEPKPENFDTANSVEAVGTFKDGAFVADRLLVKCPSKYSDEKPKEQKQA